MANRVRYRAIGTGRYMLMAALLSFGGYLAIYISHVKQNHSQFAVGHPG